MINKNDFKDDLKEFCGGGCSAKLGPDVLKQVLSKIPKNLDENINKNLMVGFESSDDAAVYKISDEVAIIKTLDFFTPIVENPYTFGKIAAANALSDVYAMGGRVLMALNIVGFPEKMNPDILSEILRGGSEKVTEAGGVLCGGHSINDPNPKYGLSVTGMAHPDKIKTNNGCKIGDKLILTKPLGVGIITTAHKIEECSKTAYDKAVAQMEFLNKYPAEIMEKYRVNGVTDVTGFGFLGHLIEMTHRTFSMKIDLDKIPYISEAYEYAKEFYITSSGQRNRNFLGDNVLIKNADFAMEEILYDPQTSGGLIISVDKDDANELLRELSELSMTSAIVGEVVEPLEARIVVE